MYGILFLWRGALAPSAEKVDRLSSGAFITRNSRTGGQGRKDSATESEIREGGCWVWKHENSTANLRESSRIAFSLRSGALLRLIAYAGIAPSLEKCWGKTRVRVFLMFSFSLFLNRSAAWHPIFGIRIKYISIFGNEC